MLLECQGLTRSFGGLMAIKDLSFSLGPGEILGLIGPNGAGKTTAFNLISGVDRPDGGHILLRGRDQTGVPSWRMARAGICRTFQNPRLFARLTVLDNVLVASRSDRTGPLAGIRSLLTFDQRCRQRARESLAFVGLAHREGELAGSLAYGHLRKLELARALAGGPALILLDEPVAGMNPTEIQEFMGLVSRIRERGIAVLLIEHHMHMVMNICDRVVVLNFGQKLAEGTPAQVSADPRVIEAYLGESQAAG